ncbi:MAG: type 1 glutamine amidotransferase [Chloroflexi bacterium]|nr:type 1 glutamine amidotransferase [Chloroflexota bacterium]
MSLQGKKVIVLAEDDYEDQELWYPYYRLVEAGATVTIVGPKAESYASKHGYPAKATLAAADARAADYAGIVIPGGYAPDRMRRYPALLKLVRDIHEQGGVVAFICHAGWVPISAGIVKGKRLTATAAIKDDLVNAGAEFVDEAVVVDGKMVTSRAPADLPVFMPAVIEALRS